MSAAQETNSQTLLTTQEHVGQRWAGILQRLGPLYCSTSNIIVDNDVTEVDDKAQNWSAPKPDFKNLEVVPCAGSSSLVCSGSWPEAHAARP